MITAKEIVARSLRGMIDVAQAEKMIIEYAKQKCKEQRELCYRNSVREIITVDEEGEEWINHYFDESEIINSPKPELE